jgi:hypothetical protein
MATAAKFRIDIAIHDLFMNSTLHSPAPAEAGGRALPEPIFPQVPERLKDPGPETPPERRKWSVKDVYRTSPWDCPRAKRRVAFCRMELTCGQNNVILRTNGTVAPCFPMYGATFDWGDIDQPKFDEGQPPAMKSACQQHCFSTLNHNLAYCYNDARVMKWLWSSVIENKFQGGVRSFED